MQALLISLLRSNFMSRAIAVVIEPSKITNCVRGDLSHFARILPLCNSRQSIMFSTLCREPLAKSICIFEADRICRPSSMTKSSIHRDIRFRWPSHRICTRRLALAIHFVESINAYIKHFPRDFHLAHPDAACTRHCSDRDHFDRSGSSTNRFGEGLGISIPCSREH